MDVIEAIKTRRSIRYYTNQKIDNSVIRKILEAGSYAPSGLNNQPWRFVVVEERDIIKSISLQTKYSNIIENAVVLLCVYLDKTKSYHYVKDVQAIGACIQNMLLASHAYDLGCCWVGEILNKADGVNEILDVPKQYELMAVITLGYPAETGEGKRIKIGDLIHAWVKSKN